MNIDLDAIRARDRIETHRLAAQPTAIINLGDAMPEFEQGVRDLWERAQNTERARIRAAVAGLPRYLTGTESLDRAAVLAAIDGEEASR